MATKLVRYEDNQKHILWSLPLRRAFLMGREIAKSEEMECVEVYHLIYGIAQLAEEDGTEIPWMDSISTASLAGLRRTFIRIVTCGRLPLSPMAKRAVDQVENRSRWMGHYTPSICHLAYELFDTPSGNAILLGLGIVPKDRLRLILLSTPCPTDVFHPWVVDATQWRIDRSAV